MIRAILLGMIGLVGASAAIGQGATTIEELLAPKEAVDDALSSEDAEIIPAQPRSYQPFETVILRALDKITGRSTDFEMQVGVPKVYGSLRIDLQTCFQTPPEEPPESAAFLKITSATTRQVQTMAAPRDLTEEELAISEAEDANVRFSGWMFASSPGLNALEHPVYDIWVIACKTIAPSELEPLSPSE